MFVFSDFAFFFLYILLANDLVKNFFNTIFDFNF